MVHVDDRAEIPRAFLGAGYSLGWTKDHGLAQVWGFLDGEFEVRAAYDRGYVQAEVQIDGWRWVSARGVLLTLDGLRPDPQDRTLQDLLDDVAAFRVRSSAGLPADLHEQMKAEGLRMAEGASERYRRRNGP
jgi:hypothetical protein